MDDNLLKKDVLDALDFEPSIQAAHIGVAVQNGVVTLTGHVPAYAQKRAAERVVKRIKGVRAIAEEIEVRPAGSNRTADDEIARRALNVLRWNTTIPRDSVQVVVQQGRVTLSGTVEWRYQRNAAVDAVSDLEGVVGLINAIEVEPHASTSDIKKRIEEALKRSAEIEAKAIRVSVSNGTVKLEGSVHDWSERSAVERAAWAAPGVKAVDDQIHIN